MRVYMAKDSISEELLGQMQNAEIQEGEKLFSVNTDFTKEELEQDLLNDEITGYIYRNQEGTIAYRIKGSGLTQTIVKSFLDQYIQIHELVNLVIDTEPEKLPDVMADLGIYQIYLEKKQTMTNSESNPFILYFYALIAMTCMFGSYWGIGLINDIQADASPLAARVNITPTKKSRLIVIYFLAALTVHYVGVLGLILYLRLVISITFTDNILLIMLASFAGSMSGISLGCLISALSKGSANKKEGISTAVSLLLSFFAGLMVVNVKYLIEQYVPILGYINPANVLTNCFYRLYYYSNHQGYYESILILSGLTAVMLLISYFRFRGSKYDSI
jgi:ABC-2 type transport system permease protein